MAGLIMAPTTISLLMALIAIGLFRFLIPRLAAAGPKPAEIDPRMAAELRLIRSRILGLSSPIDTSPP